MGEDSDNKDNKTKWKAMRALGALTVIGSLVLALKGFASWRPGISATELELAGIVFVGGLAAYAVGASMAE